MSALAKWCLSEGCSVTGSDRVYSEMLGTLSELGAKVYVGSDSAVSTSADLVVYTSAVGSDDEELKAAVCAGVPTYERHRFLGMMQHKCDKVIAVSGTHGKTTSTSLIAAIFKNAGEKFTAHIGGEAADLGGNFYKSGYDFLVTEACEYRSNFLSLYPDTAVILNIESDHPDCFKTIGELYDSFAKFVRNAQNNGFIVINDRLEYTNLHIFTNVHIITFGLSSTSYCRATNIFEHDGLCTYDILLNQKYYMTVTPKLYGRHNIFNALAAVTVANLYGIDKDIVKNTLENFKGVKRRFESSGEVNGAAVICDYAHHPSEIKAAIAAARAVTGGDLRVYFQPHTYSRTDKYFEQFEGCFSGADELCFLPTYAAREKPDDGRSAFDLFFSINENVREAFYFDSFTGAAVNILKKARKGDTILILGAGDIDKLAKLL